jgi:hypothetical protein
MNTLCLFLYKEFRNSFLVIKVCQFNKLFCILTTSRFFFIAIELYLIMLVAFTIQFWWWV